MTTITLEAVIPAPPEAVYDYVTRPARWKEWHPASCGAQAHAAEPLSAGAEFEEEILAAGFRRRLVWHVEAADPALRWAARGRMADGSLVHLIYEFYPESGGTRFRRTLSYAIHPRWLRWLNNLLLWRKVAAESRRAMANLQARLGAGKNV